MLLKLFFLLLLCQTSLAEDGYRLWLRYEPVGDTVLREDYLAHATEIVAPTNLLAQKVIRSELDRGWSGLPMRRIGGTPASAFSNR